MKFFTRFVGFIGALVLFSGCVTTSDQTEEAVVNTMESMEYLQPGLRPEVLLFPDYLMMEDIELFQHGRIPETELVGAGMKSDLSLSVIRGRFEDVLAVQGWTPQKMEIGGGSFRMIANKKGDYLEIRGVQGEGNAQVFLLYGPRDGVSMSGYNVE